jgi:hypothetical protein
MDGSGFDWVRHRRALVALSHRVFEDSSEEFKCSCPNKRHQDSCYRETVCWSKYALPNILFWFSDFPKGIKDLLEDLNPQLLTTILSEFDKVEGTSAPEPTRQSLDVINSAPAVGPSKAAAAGAGDPLDELFPRVELDGLLKGTTVLTDGKSDAWKTKKEALETLQTILDQGANKRLKPSMGLCVFARIRTRY